MPSLNTGANVGIVDTTGLGFYRADAGGNRFPLFGRGIDGPVLHTSGSKNINTQVLGTASLGRTVDAPVTAVTAIASDVLTVASTSNFRANDICIVINLRGSSTRYSQVGKWEFVLIESVDSATQLTLKAALGNLYGQDGSLDPTNADLTGQSIVIQRLPEYDSVNVTGTATITCNAFNGTVGGVCAFMCASLTTAAGAVVAATATGFRGGAAGSDGEGYRGTTYAAGNTGGQVGGAGTSGGSGDTRGGGGGGSGGGGGGAGSHRTAGTAGGVGGGAGSAGGRGQPGTSPIPFEDTLPGTNASGQTGGGFGGGTGFPTGAGGSGPNGGSGGTFGSAVSYPYVLDIGPVLMGGGGGGSGVGGSGAAGAGPSPGQGGGGGNGGSSAGAAGGGIAMVFAKTTTSVNLHARGGQSTAGNASATTPGINPPTNGGYGGGGGGGGASPGGPGAGGGVILVTRSLNFGTISDAGGPSTSGGAGTAGGAGGPLTPAVPPSFGAATAGGPGGAGAPGAASGVGGSGYSLARYFIAGSTLACLSPDGLGGGGGLDGSIWKATL